MAGRKKRWLAVALWVGWGIVAAAGEIRCLVVQNENPVRRGPSPFGLFLNEEISGTEILECQDFLPLHDFWEPPRTAGGVAFAEASWKDWARALDVVRTEALREFGEIYKTFPGDLQEEIRENEWFGCNIGAVDGAGLEDARERARARGEPWAAFREAVGAGVRRQEWGDALLSFVEAEGGAERIYVRGGDLGDVLEPLRRGGWNGQLVDFWLWHASGGGVSR